MKLKHDELLSNLACLGFTCNLRPYTPVLLLFFIYSYVGVHIFGEVCLALLPLHLLEPNSLSASVA